MDTKKGFSKEFWRYLAFLFLFSTIIFMIFAFYAAGKLNAQRDISMLLCNITNKESEIIKDIYPYYSEQACETFQNLNSTSADFICTGLKNLKLPDKLECEELIK